LLAGAYDGPLQPRPVAAAEPYVAFAGRHIPEKRVPALLPALVRARARLPQLRAVILGDGPDRPRVLALIDELGLRDAVDAPGFVATESVDEIIGKALCMVLPSKREGYGLIVIEASARATPSIVVAGPDNAAVELVSPGENGIVARSASPQDLADAIVAISEAGASLRRSTSDWFAANARRLSLDSSLQTVSLSYARSAPRSVERVSARS
jgi:glycosyltransferase involved in cell wall biosynthesis